ncbi:MAG TPA: hypothetical protein VNW97_01680 [Candidatus Saccharimonadales bacterium]|nr:hypothetical protein [Candidatus Saccharimonadales bacterium]
MRRISLFSLLCLMAALCAAQECTTYVVLNAFEPKLRLEVETLKASDLEVKWVKDRGRTGPSIASITRNYKSRLLVLIETDGVSVNRDTKEVIDTVTKLARQAPEGQPVAFGVYAGRAVFTKGFFPDPKERETAISAVREEANVLGKRVALYRSLLEAVKLFGEHQPGDAILLVGSPYDDWSNVSAGDVERAFKAAGVRLLVMLREPLSSLNRDDFLVNSHETEKRMFSELTAQTGGHYSDFDAAAFGFAWRGYMLEIKLPVGAGAGKKWKLKLQGPAAETLRDARLSFPEQPPPCGKTPPEHSNMATSH